MSMIFSRRNADLILLHAPSIYDFRKVANLLGPISDVIPSTPVFEMYPVGFSSLAEYLGAHNVSVRIINLAYRMLSNPGFDVEKTIRKLRPKAFGIDLHWLPHAHGSVEIAKICKKYHPTVPVIFGGYSATYFHRELLDYHEIDFVIRGDSTEESLHQLMRQVGDGGQDFEQIPGLSWRHPERGIVENPMPDPPESLNQYMNNYVNLFKMAIRFRDIKSLTAIHDWWRYPITAVLTCRGCTENCAICGGSKYALKHYGNRRQPSYRDPALIVQDILNIGRFTRAPIFVIGDLNQPGEWYANQILSGLKKRPVKNQIVFELFNPSKEDYFKDLGDAGINFNFEMSPESHAYEVRKAAGKFYKNEDMENNIKWALENGCQKFDIFFMIGLPEQTSDSVLETVEYCEYLLGKFGKRVVPFISPLAPFLDPGSLAYENPDAYGYRILFHKFEDYRRALLKPSWKYMLSFETRWLDREAILQLTYEAGKRLSRIKHKFGLIDDAALATILNKIDIALKKHQQIAQSYEGNEAAFERELEFQLQTDMRIDSMATICGKEEIKWPSAAQNFKFLNIARAILFD
ncbi:TIGR04190 family B12-binding domain/radical SAM domain protein [candidate division KSB1 bacterium]|nr:TIGR04190 family B12-binding domain/radical SAM domain protein [candidate division KSB1 bacterium]